MMDSELTTALDVDHARSFPSLAARTAHYRKLYQDAVQLVAAERAKADQEKLKTKEKKEEEEKKDDNEDPCKLMKKLGKRVATGMDTDGGEQEVDVDIEKLMEMQAKRTATLLSKNGQSPGVGQGAPKDKWWKRQWTDHREGQWKPNKNVQKGKAKGKGGKSGHSNGGWAEKA